VYIHIGFKTAVKSLAPDASAATVKPIAANIISAAAVKTLASDSVISVATATVAYTSDIVVKTISETTGGSCYCKCFKAQNYHLPRYKLCIREVVGYFNLY
jgi:spore maturation protein SpmA